MKPENSSATDRGRGQQRADKTGKTTDIPDSPSPPGTGPSVARRAEGEQRRQEAEEGPGDSRPKTRRLGDRPSQGGDRGLHP